jgi:hypothetical protein
VGAKVYPDNIQIKSALPILIESAQSPEKFTCHCTNIGINDIWCITSDLVKTLAKYPLNLFHLTIYPNIGITVQLCVQLR